MLSAEMPQFKPLREKSVSADSACPWDPAHCLVGVEPHQIYADGWAIGYDDRFPKHTRLQQAFVFARYSEHENLYAHPLVGFFYSLAEFIDLIYVITGFRCSHRLPRREGCPDRLPADLQKDRGWFRRVGCLEYRAVPIVRRLFHRVKTRAHSTPCPVFRFPPGSPPGGPDSQAS